MTLHAPPQFATHRRAAAAHLTVFPTKEGAPQAMPKPARLLMLQPRRRKHPIESFFNREESLLAHSN